MSSEWSGDMKWKTAVGDWSEELYVAAARDLLLKQYSIDQLVLGLTMQTKVFSPSLDNKLSMDWLKISFFSNEFYSSFGLY